MPIVKQTLQGGKDLHYHVVTSVEFLRKPGGLHWRGSYRSYDSFAGTRPPVASGTITGVPVSDFSVDPIEAFERACIAHPDNVFFGGEYVAPGDTPGGLEVERRLAWARVKTARDVHLDGGVDTPYGRFDSDLVSIVNILGAKESMLENSSMPWIRKDYSQVSLTKVQIGEIGNALAAFRAQGYGWGSALHSQIDAASTAEAVRAIVWTPPA